jgi:hypothetical protein
MRLSRRRSFSSSILRLTPVRDIEGISTEVAAGDRDVRRQRRPLSPIASLVTCTTTESPFLSRSVIGRRGRRACDAAATLAVVTLAARLRLAAGFSDSPSS